MTVHEPLDPRRWPALVVLLLGAFLPILDFNVVNLALPAIREDLGASPAQQQFMISAYAATYAVFLVTGGRLGDWFGRKRLFMTGVAGFTIASALCAMAATPAMLIAARMLQGLTATWMAPQVLASIRVLFLASEQGVALGFYGATFGLANIVGQILGGVLVAARPFGLPWQAIFLVNLPVGLAAFAGAAWLLRDSRAADARRLDFGGVFLLSLTLGLLVYPLVEGRENGWPSWAFAMLAGACVSLVVFICFEGRVVRRGGSPLVELGVFREPGFAQGVAMALLYYMLSAFYLAFSVYLQGGLHLSALDAGRRTLPFGFGYFAASFAAARIMDRFGARALTIGFLVQAVGFGCLALLAMRESHFATAPALFVAGIGFGIVMPSIIKAVLGGVDSRHAGLASGIVISTFQIGAALGVAIVGGIFFSLLGPAPDMHAHARAFAGALGCNVLLLLVAAGLSLKLPRSA